jgi:hypothetical protein
VNDDIPLFVPFDQASPLISAYEIHEWLYDCLHMQEQSLLIIQIDGTKRQVFFKFLDGTFTTFLRKSKDRLNTNM